MKKLTKKSRWMLYLSLFISGLVIFSTVFYIIAARDGKNDKTENLVLVIIIIIAALAILSMLVSRMKLRKNTKNLSPEYFEAYEEISDMLNGVAMSNMEKKETMTDILDLFLLADKDEKKVSEVVGKNINEFVEQIQDSFGYRSKVFFHFLTGVQYSVLYIFMMQGAEFLKAENGLGFFGQEIAISLPLLLIPLAFFGIPLMVNFIRKSKLVLAMIVPIVLMGIFIAVMETLNKFYLHIPWVYTLVEGHINVMPNFGVLFLWIITFALSSFLKVVQRRLSIKKL